MLVIVTVTFHVYMLEWHVLRNCIPLCFTDRPSSSVLTTVFGNTTVLRGKELSLNCSTDANPLYSVTYNFYFNGGYIGSSSSGVFNATVQADGVYMCVPINTVGTGHNASVRVTAVGKSVIKYLFNGFL